MGNRAADHQRADQARSGGVGNAFQVSTNLAGLSQHLIAQRQQLAHMVPRCQLRHHAAIVRVHIDLTEQGVRKQPLFAVEQGHAGFITGGFNTENQHNIRATLIGMCGKRRILAETRNALSDSSEQSLTLP